MAQSECEVCGELIYRSGESRRFASRTPNTISGIVAGVRSLQQQVNGALSQLVQQEQHQQAPGGETAASGSGEDDNNEDGLGEDEDSEDEQANQGDGDALPAKRIRKQS